MACALAVTGIVVAGCAFNSPKETFYTLDAAIAASGADPVTARAVAAASTIAVLVESDCACRARVRLGSTLTLIADDEASGFEPRALAALLEAAVALREDRDGPARHAMNEGGASLEESVVRGDVATDDPADAEVRRARFEGALGGIELGNVEMAGRAEHAGEHIAPGLRSRPSSVTSSPGPSDCRRCCG